MESDARIDFLREQREKTSTVTLRPMRLGPTPSEILKYQQDKAAKKKAALWFKMTPRQKKHAARKAGAPRHRR